MTEKLINILKPKESIYYPKLLSISLVSTLINNPVFITQLFDNCFGPTGYPDIPIFHVHEIFSNKNPDGSINLTINDDERILGKHQDPSLDFFKSILTFHDECITQIQVNNALHSRLNRLATKNRIDLRNQFLNDTLDTIVRGGEVIDAGNGIQVFKDDPMKQSKLADFVNTRKLAIKKYNSNL